MSVAFAVDIRRLIVAPGVRETIYGVGNTFTVLTADVAGNPDPDFRIGLSDQSPVRFARGLRYRMPDAEIFDRLTIENPGGAAAPLDIQVMIACGDVSDERAQLVGTVTANIGSMPAVQIAAGQSVSITGTAAVSMARRPVEPLLASEADVTVATGATVQVLGTDVIHGTFVLQHLGGGAVRVSGSGVGASTGVRLAWGQSVTIQTAGPVWVRNIGGGQARLARMRLSY